jgi:hypothetical protein
MSELVEELRHLADTEACLWTADADLIRKAADVLESNRCSDCVEMPDLSPAQEVERFDPQIAGATEEGFLPMDRTVDGAWVRFEDFKAEQDAATMWASDAIGLRVDYQAEVEKREEVEGERDAEVDARVEAQGQYTDGKLDEEKVWHWLSSYKNGDRVEIMDPPSPLNAPSLYGTVVREARKPDDKSILVLIDGLKLPLRFYASQIQRNPPEPARKPRKWWRFWKRGEQ